MIDKEQNLNETQKPELGISDVIQRFIQNERDRLEDRRQFYLTKKGDYSFHNLNSIQGQLGVLDRLEDVLKNVV